jgi:hypothetical protein
MKFSQPTLQSIRQYQFNRKADEAVDKSEVISDEMSPSKSNEYKFY